MHYVASPYRLFALALALVLFTSVALPSVAHACAMVNTAAEKTAACCQPGEDGGANPLPCHGDAPATPVGDTAEMACCTAVALVTSHEAALNEGVTVPVATPLAHGPWQPVADSSRPFPPADREVPGGSAPSLFLLHGALLN